MRKLLIALLLTTYSHSILAQSSIPIWLERAENIPEIVNVSTPLPEDAGDFVSEYLLPLTADDLIGYEVKIISPLPHVFRGSILSTTIDLAINNGYFQSPTGISLLMNIPPLLNIDSKDFIYKNWGYTKGTPDYYTGKILLPIEWTEKFQSGEEPIYTNKQGVLIYEINVWFNNHTKYPVNAKVESSNTKLLNEGKIRFTRLQPVMATDLISDLNVKNGKLVEGTSDISAGHYKIEVLEPKTCSGVINDNLVITPEFLDSNEMLNLSVHCLQEFDVFVTYQYSQIGTLKTVWNDITIAPIPSDYSTISKTSYERDSEGNMIDTDGNLLQIPFTDIYDPTHAYYGMGSNGEDFTSFPNVISTTMTADLVWRVGTRDTEEEMAHFIDFAYSTIENEDFNKGYNIDMNIALDLYEEGDEYNAPRWIKMYPSVSIDKCLSDTPESHIEFCDDEIENQLMMNSLSKGEEYTRNFYGWDGATLQLKFVPKTN